MEVDPDVYYSVRQLSRLVPVSYERLIVWVNDGKLKAYNTNPDGKRPSWKVKGSDWLVRWAQLQNRTDPVVRRVKVDRTPTPLLDALRSDERRARSLRWHIQRKGIEKATAGMPHHEVKRLLGLIEQMRK